MLHLQWRREEVKAGGGYFQKWEKRSKSINFFPNSEKRSKKHLLFPKMGEKVKKH